MACALDPEMYVHISNTLATHWQHTRNTQSSQRMACALDSEGEKGIKQKTKE
jgi:hypothetical protein